MKKITLIASILLSLLLAVWLAAPRQKITSNEAETFDMFIDAIMEENAIPSLAIAVIKDHEIIQLAGYGFADIASGRAMTADTPMNTASISKPILGITILQLKDHSLLDLDTNINTYLPFEIDNPNIDGETVSIRNLATHTSSIADFISPDYYAQTETDILLQDYVRNLLAKDGKLYQDGTHYLSFEPGSVREYSNLGAGVAGTVAETVGAANLNQLLSEGIFKPLGMANSSWRVSDYPTGSLATRYDVRQCAPYTGLCATSIQPRKNYLISKVFNPPISKKRFESYPQYINQNYPDGGLNSSVRDLATLTRTILNDGKFENGALLSPESFEEMLALQLPASVSTRQRFFWRDRNGMTGHTGSNRGVFTSLYFDTDRGDAIIVLMNRTPDGGTENAMAKIYNRIKSQVLSDQ